MGLQDRIQWSKRRGTEKMKEERKMMMKKKKKKGEGERKVATSELGIRCYLHKAMADSPG